MPKYTRPPDLPRQIHDHERRIRALENMIVKSGRGGSGGEQGTPVFDTNSIANGSLESGNAGWGRSYWNNDVGIGTLVVDSRDPLAGARSLRMDEPEGGAQTMLTWGNTDAPAIGYDVFETAPGEVWQITITARTTEPIPNFNALLCTGRIATKTMQVFDPDTTWVAAIAVPLDPEDGAQTLVGTAVVPADRFFCTLSVRPDTMPEETPAFSWWVDELSLQRKLQ